MLVNQDVVVKLGNGRKEFTVNRHDVRIRALTGNIDIKTDDVVVYEEQHPNVPPNWREMLGMVVEFNTKIGRNPWREFTVAFGWLRIKTATNHPRLKILPVLALHCKYRNIGRRTMKYCSNESYRSELAFDM